MFKNKRNTIRVDDKIESEAFIVAAEKCQYV